MMRLRDRFDRSKRRPSTKRQRIGFAFFWLIVLAYAYMIPLAPNWNSESHLFLTFSMVDHGSLNIDPYHVRLGDESYYRSHYYSDKAPGLSFLALPAYAGFRVLNPHYQGQGYIAHSHMQYSIRRNTVYLRYVITYLIVVLPSAIFAVLLWLFLGNLIGNVAWALAATAAYSLGTIAYVYSTQFFSHQITAILLFGSFLLFYSRARKKPASPRVLLATAFAGLLAGYAVITEYPAVLTVGLLAVYLFVVAADRLKALGAFAAGLAPPAVLGGIYNFLAFGKPFTTSYAYVRSSAYHSNVHPGVLGLTNPFSYGMHLPSLNALWQITFGPYRGIFLISPVLLLFFVGAALTWKNRELRPELWLCLAVVALTFLLDASRNVDQNGWSGGWSVASRHLTPMLPFMLVPIALGLRNRLYRLVFLGLGILSVAITFMAVVSGDAFDSADHNPLVNEMLPHLVHGKLIGNWGNVLGLTGARGLVPLAVLAFGLVLRLLWLHDWRPHRGQSHEPRVIELEAS